MKPKEPPVEESPYRDALPAKEFMEAVEEARKTTPKEPTVKEWEIIKKDFLDILDTPASNFTDKKRWMCDWLASALEAAKKEVYFAALRDARIVLKAERAKVIQEVMEIAKVNKHTMAQIVGTKRVETDWISLDELREKLKVLEET